MVVKEIAHVVGNKMMTEKTKSMIILNGIWIVAIIYYVFFKDWS
jgi:hypothetical protein